MKNCYAVNLTLTTTFVPYPTSHSFCLHARPLDPLNRALRSSLNSLTLLGVGRW